MEKENDKIDDILDIVPISITGDIVIENNTNIIPIKETEDSKLQEDFNEVRDNLKKLTNKTADAIENILSLADELESPARAYEVASDLIKTSMELNSRLLQSHKTLKEIENSKNSNNGNTTNNTNNTLFVGNTAQLLEYLKKNRTEQDNK